MKSIGAIDYSKIKRIRNESADGYPETPEKREMVRNVRKDWSAISTALRTVMRNEYDGQSIPMNSLSTVYDELASQFGKDRVNNILSLMVLGSPHEGRICNQVRSWAKQNIGELEEIIDEREATMYVEPMGIGHPALVDGFLRILIRNQQSKNESKKGLKEDLVDDEDEEYFPDVDSTDKQLSFEDLKDIVDSIIPKLSGVYKDANGRYYVEIYRDYRDELEAETAAEILASDSPSEMYYEYITDAYMDSETYELDEVYNQVIETLSKAGRVYDEDELRDIVMDSIYVEYPDFMEDSYECVILVTTPEELNQDATLNPYYYTLQNDIIDLEDDAGLVWLAKTQGYTKQQLIDVLQRGDIRNPKGFLESAVQEAANATSHMNCLAFLCKLTLSELMDIKENKRDVKVSKDTMCGLFDVWAGGGSVLELQLEKEVIIPNKYILWAGPDMGVSKNSYGYSVDNVYGLSGEAYRGKATVIKAQDPSDGKDKNESVANKPKAINKVLNTKLAAPKKVKEDFGEEHLGVPEKEDKDVVGVLVNKHLSDLSQLGSAYIDLELLYAFVLADLIENNADDSVTIKTIKKIVTDLGYPIYTVGKYMIIPASPSDTLEQIESMVRSELLVEEDKNVQKKKEAKKEDEEEDEEDTEDLDDLSDIKASV